MSPVEMLIKSLQDPDEEWLFDCYTATHRAKNVSIWIANVPMLSLETYPVAIGMSLMEKLKVYRAMKTARRNWLIRKLS